MSGRSPPPPSTRPLTATGRDDHRPASALTYLQVADILSAELGRCIHYTQPGLLRYTYHARDSLRMPWGMVAVTAAFYTTARLGRAARTSNDIHTVLGHNPIDFTEFAHRTHRTWVP